jgi:hypothetical protein
MTSAYREFRLTLLNRVYILPEGEVRIGRDPACHVCLEGDLVSRVHAILRLGPDGAHLSDTGSANGTFANGVRLAGPVTLKHGDRVRVAFFDLLFEELARSGGEALTHLMVFCTECGTVLSPTMRFCVQCGARVRRSYQTRKCPSCGVTATRDMRFCFRCGADLSGPGEAAGGVPPEPDPRSRG